jgi:glycosyltransferase involved in cell wall biosynthesis
MRIGFDANSLTGLSGVGIIKYITKIVEYTSSKKIDCFLFAQNDLKAKLSGPHIKFVKDKGKGFYKPYWDQFVVPGLIKKYKIDLYHAPSNLGLPACPKKPCKMVVTIHDIAPVVLAEYYKKASKEIFLEYQSYPGISARFADKVIAISNNTKKDLCRIFNIGAEKIKVIFQGEDEKVKQLLDKNIIRQYQKKYGFGEEYIMYVSEIALRKNHENLFRAFSKMRKKYGKDVKLLLAGRAHEEFVKPLKAVIASLGQGENIIFLDYVPEKGLSVLLSYAKLMVYPSLYEGFGLPVLEAMACGCPVACSNVSSLPEVVGNAAYLFDPYDIDSIAKAIEIGVTDKAWREDAAREGFKRVKDFSWNKTQQKTFEVYRSLLK